MPGPVGPDKIRRVADAALGVSGVDGVEVLFMHQWAGLTRFARSSVHQSTWREDTGIRVRVIAGRRTGVAATNGFGEASAREAAASAREMALVSSPDPDFAGLAPRADAPVREGGFDDATASTTPEARTTSIVALVGRVRDGFQAAGAYETAAAEIAVANTEGQFCWAPYTRASITAVVSGGEEGSGFGERISARAADLDFEEIGRRAMDKAFASQGPRDAEPGRYTVILEPAATSTLSEFLAYLGFSGRALAEGRSCFSGNEGEQVAAASISIRDDALAPGTLGIPFDFEGTPKKQVTLVENGVFKGGVHDRRSAKQTGTESTGHALPAPNPEGPFPLNMCVDAGDATVEQMIASTERGLLVTRLHYANVVNPMDAVITGMTRDGTFLIEGGAIVGPVKNLRFTQSIPEALKSAEMVGRDRELAGEFFFADSLVPALKLGDFQFTSASDH